MKRTDHVIKSKKLGKSVNVRVYGSKGYPVIAFPTQDQMADEWEANGMTEVFSPYVDEGRVQLFTVDSNDLESWSNPSDDFAARIRRQEDYYDFVCEELVPFVHEQNASQLRPELTGASLGATQATICALRRPDLFQGVIALSGMYHTSYFFGDWGNETSYANDVNAFLPNTPEDHPYIELYRHRTFAFAIGQAPDEQFGVDDLHFLQQTFDRLGISGWFDFWGPESSHDWYWWKQQMGKFLPEAVKELEGVATAEPELTRPKAPAKAEAKPDAKASKAQKADASKPTPVKATEAAKAKPAKTTTTTAAKPVAKKAEPASKGTAKQVSTKTTTAKASKPATAPKTVEASAHKSEKTTKTASAKVTKPAPAAKAAAKKATAQKKTAKATATAKKAPAAKATATTRKSGTSTRKAGAKKSAK